MVKTSAPNCKKIRICLIGATLLNLFGLKNLWHPSEMTVGPREFHKPSHDCLRAGNHTGVRNWSPEPSRTYYRITSASPAAQGCSRDSRPRAGRSARAAVLDGEHPCVGIVD